MKFEAAALPSVMSLRTNPVTASEKVKVAVKATLLVVGTVIATVGAVLSST